MLKRLILAIVLILAVVWAIGCESAAEPTAPEPVDTTYQGEWTGTTAQGLTITFTVTGNSITSLGIDMQKTVNNNPVNTSYSLSEIATIFNGSFNIQANAPDSTQPGYFTTAWVTVSGTFTSTTSAQGSAGNQANQIPPVNWTATKN